MAHLFAKLALLFVAGGGIAAVVTGNCWPLILVMIALFFLVKVFSACDSAPPPEAHAPKPVYHRGRKDRRMPT